MKSFQEHSSRNRGKTRLGKGVLLTYTLSHILYTTSNESKCDSASHNGLFFHVYRKTWYSCPLYFACCSVVEHNTNTNFKSTTQKLKKKIQSLQNITLITCILFSPHRIGIWILFSSGVNRNILRKTFVSMRERQQQTIHLLTTRGLNRNPIVQVWFRRTL